MTNDPHAVWSELLATGPNLQRRFEHHPLRLHYGTDHISRPILLLRLDQRPDLIQLGDSVSIEINERPAQKEWAMVLTLREPNLTDTFIDLAINLADRSSSGADERQSLAIFRRVLEEFRDLLARGRGAALSLEELRGVVAELWFALRIVAPLTDPTAALIAWHGPLGAPQDFRFPDRSLAEVKAIHSEARSVKISSPEQLDPVDSDDLTLVTIGLEECPPSTPGSTSLPHLVKEFRDAFTGDPARSADLDRRLRALGILRTFDSLATEFLVTSTHRYRVDEEFPRIRRNAVSLGIENLRYEIQLRSIRDHELPGDFTITLSEG